MSTPESRRTHPRSIAGMPTEIRDYVGDHFATAGELAAHVEGNPERLRLLVEQALSDAEAAARAERVRLLMRGVATALSIHLNG